MKPELCKIKIDKENLCIHWGDLHKQTYFKKNLDWRYVAKTLGYTKMIQPYSREIKGKRIYGQGTGTKEQNQALTKKLGISPKKFAHMLKGAQYKLWVKGKEDLISKLCVMFGHWSPDKLWLLNKNWDIISQYKDDSIDHLIPLAMYTSLGTKELKKKLGKSLWKSFCNNSFYRNKFICHNAGALSLIKVDSEEYEIAYFNKYKLYNDIPSSIFRYHNKDFKNISIDVALWGINILKKNKELTHKDKLRYLCDIYNDTKRMSKQLSESFNPVWSEKRMKESHDRYTKLVQARNHPDNYIECLRDIPIKEYSSMGYTAKLLDTPRQISLQGQDQHHCVGSYVSNVKRGDYLVYDIKKDDKTVSTLGINIIVANTVDLMMTEEKEKSFSYNQHYRKYDKPVSYNEDLFAKQVIYELNQKVYDKDEI